MKQSTTTEPWFAQTLNHGDHKFLEEAGLTSKIVKVPLQANEQVIPDIKVLMRLDDNTFYRTVSSSFEVVQPDEFLNMTTQIGGPVYSAGQTENGEIVYFTTIPQANKNFSINSDIYQNFILFALSYNANIGISIIPISVNLTRNLTYNVSEMLRIPKPKFRQSKNSKQRARDLSEFKEVYDNCLSQLSQFQKKLENMSQETDISFTDIINELVPIDKDHSSKIAITKKENLIEDIRLHHNTLFGTSMYSLFTAIYATDISKHDKRRLTLARQFFAGKTSRLAVTMIKLSNDEQAA